MQRIHVLVLLVLPLLLALALPAAAAAAQAAEGGSKAGAPRYPPYDGSRNNADNPSWG
jgi:hypothetical protein